MRGGERRDEVGRGREVGPVPGLRGGDAERDREMALADPGRSEEQRVAVLLDEAQGGQLGDDRPVDAGLEVELELRQALVERVVGEPEPPESRRALVASTSAARRRSSTSTGAAVSVPARSSSAARCSDAVARPRYARCSRVRA